MLIGGVEFHREAAIQLFMFMITVKTKVLMRLFEIKMQAQHKLRAILQRTAITNQIMIPILENQLLI